MAIYTYVRSNDPAERTQELVLRNGALVLRIGQWADLTDPEFAALAQRYQLDPGASSEPAEVNNSRLTSVFDLADFFGREDATPGYAVVIDEEGKITTAPSLAGSGSGIYRGKYASGTAYKAGDLFEAPDGTTRTVRNDFTAGAYDTAQSRHVPNGHLYNVNASSLRNWRKAVARGRIATPARIVVAGDSTVDGSSGDSPFRTEAMPPRVERQLQASLGGPIGDFVQAGALLGGTFQQDPRVTNSGFIGVSTGGFWATAAAGISGAFFTLTEPFCDRLVVYHLRQTNGAAYTPTVDGVPQSAVTTNGTDAVVATTILAPGGLGSHVFRIDASGTGAGGNNTTIVGVRALAGDITTGVEVFRIGRQGRNTNDLVAAGNLAAFNRPSFLADLYVVQMEVNDRAANLLPATYKSNLTTFINQCQTAGADVLLVVPCDGQTGLTYTHQQMIDVLYELADEKNCALVDMQQRWGGQALAAAAGLMADGVHPTTRGYWDLSAAITDALLVGGQDRSNAVVRRQGPKTVGTAANNTFATGRAATGSRPTAAEVGVGAQFYDTTLGKPIWSNGTDWKDAAGTTV